MRKLKKYIPTKFKAEDSIYDKDAADFAVMFIESLCHTKGINDTENGIGATQIQTNH